MIRRLSVFCFVLVGFYTAVAAPGHAQGSTAQPLQVDADFQKLDAMMKALRDRNARDYAITSENGIDEARYVAVGGLEQWITIRGEDRKNPVLLFLHGGPGDATNPWGYAGFRSWLRSFTVVQWDQRGAGRTLGRNGPSLAPTITIDRMVQDGIELAELLRKELQKDKIVLVGHSFGSILGVLMAKARPDLFYAYVGTAQVGDEVRNYAVAYTDLLKKAEILRDPRAIRELKEIGPPPTQMAGGTGSSANGRTCLRARTASSIRCSASHSLHQVFAARHQRMGRGTRRERSAPAPSDVHARAAGARRSVCSAGLRDPGAEDFTTPTSLARSFLIRFVRPARRLLPSREAVTSLCS
jgi:pimeloyl-ACP methyl ester carboxylesterase